MRIPYGFTLTSSGTLEINRSEANVVRMIFDFYMAGASLGKVVDMLHAKQISSPTGKAKWTRAAVDHLLSNGKYIAVIGMEKFMDAQFEKSARCNVDYDKEGTPSHYGQEIFRGEYQKDLEGFVQILVNSRNRIAHIKSKQNRKFLNGDESVLYLHKLSLMYRIILLDLLDIPLNRYKERLSNRIETINCWWADRCDQ